jgi:hypothetical protein
MQSPVSFTPPPLPDFVHVAETILAGGFAVVAVLFVLGTLWEMRRKR